jgi:pimeloyl-ACP methyl ester carboxylesterase
LDAIECPADVYVGTEDVFTPKGMARALETRLVAEAQLEEVDGEGHFTLCYGRYLGTVLV